MLKHYVVLDGRGTNLAIAVMTVMAMVAWVLPSQAVTIADFRFNEGSGTTTADSVIGNDGGTLSAGVSFSADTPDGSTSSLSFPGDNGSEERVTVVGTTPASYVDPTLPFTISVSFKTADISTGFSGLVSVPNSSGTAFQLFLSAVESPGNPGYQGIVFGNEGNQFETMRTVNITDPNATLGNNQWQDILLTYDGVDPTAFSSFEVYLNGAPQTIGDASNFAGQSNDDLQIGGWLGRSDGNFNGLIDNLEITLPPPLQAGDVNGDGFVDSADFEIIRSNFFSTGASRSDGDLTSDGNVDLEDFGQWKDNFPFPAPPLSALTASVPEPSSVVLVGMALVTVGFTRRRSIPTTL